MPLSFVPFALTHASISYAHLSLSTKKIETLSCNRPIFRFNLEIRALLFLGGPQQVKTVVLYGLCAKTPALLDEVVKMFLGAQIEHPGAGDCAKGAALLLAGSRGLLSALPVRFPSLVASEVAAKHRCLGLGWCAVCRSMAATNSESRPKCGRRSFSFLFSPPFFLCGLLHAFTLQRKGSRCCECVCSTPTPTPILARAIVLLHPRTGHRL